MPTATFVSIFRTQSTLTRIRLENYRSGIWSKKKILNLLFQPYRYFIMTTTVGGRFNYLRWSLSGGSSVCVCVCVYTHVYNAHAHTHRVDHSDKYFFFPIIQHTRTQVRVLNLHGYVCFCDTVPKTNPNRFLVYCFARASESKRKKKGKK